jgi:hypothetical protein
MARSATRPHLPPIHANTGRAVTTFRTGQEGTQCDPVLVQPAQLSARLFVEALSGFEAAQHEQRGVIVRIQRFRHAKGVGPNVSKRMLLP